MNKVVINKISLPAWLEELLNKGKYARLKTTRLNKDDNIKLIENHKILNEKATEKVKYKPNNMKPIQKILNGNLFTFDPINKTVTTEINND